MSGKVTINSLELENVKRIKAVKLEPSASGLTVIGGRNAQGKTSVLDSIAWVLGGNKFKPSEPKRTDSVLPPTLCIKLSNGLVVERKGKNSELKVTDPNGNKAGQNLLDSFIEELALNLPKFMQSSGKEKANILLQIIGVGEQLAQFELQEKEVYNERLAVGRIADQKKKYAGEMPYYGNVPDDFVSASELIKQQQDILARNGENQRKREQVSRYENLVSTKQDEVLRLEQQLAQKRDELNQYMSDLETAKKSALDLLDESTEELEENIRNIEEINQKIRINLDKEKADEDAKEYSDQYATLTTKLESIRQDKFDLLKNANLPLNGLSIENGELVYKNQRWDNMSSAEQMIVATSIVQKLKPECGFVLIDKLEQMDVETMQEYGKWAEQQGLQIIATRVSTGSECSVIIEDGYVLESSMVQPKKKWEAGKF